MKERKKKDFHFDCTPIPFEDLLLLVRVKWPVVVHVVPDMTRQVVRLILHQADGRQDVHNQFLVLIFETLWENKKTEMKMSMVTKKQVMFHVNQKINLEVEKEGRKKRQNVLPLFNRLTSSSFL